MVGVVAIVLLALIVSGNNEYLFLAATLLIPAVLLGAVGLIDDIRNLDPLPRLIVQTIAGIFTAIFVLETTSVGNPTGSLLLDGFISLFWIVGIINSINFFDNLDGGAAGTVAFTSLGTFVIALDTGQYFIGATAIVVSGAMLGFLVWNKSPARIYMGDAGAVFLGFIVAVLTLRLNPDVDGKLISFSIPLLLLALPLMDTAVAVISRITRGISPFEGGKDHLSHRLLQHGVSKKTAVYILWVLSGFFMLSACLIALQILDNFAFLALNLVIWILLFGFFLKSDSLKS
jgi:UDP-GlcNAc:undecaprenyl-phosphate GlcNAc-1-phosphate transferase